jgi:Uma2 family endonuclease
MNAPMMTIARTTNAADGLARRAFTVAEIEAMVEAGIIPPDERFELIGGEVVPMAAKGARHEILKTALMFHWASRCPPNLRFTPETTFRLSADTFLEPDFTVYRKADGIRGLNGGNALLAVEIADSSLGYDLGRKPGIYASFGMRELWVIDAIELVTHVHRQPAGERYLSVTVHAATEALVPELVPDLATTLSALDLDL